MGEKLPGASRLLRYAIAVVFANVRKLRVLVSYSSKPLLGPFFPQLDFRDGKYTCIIIYIHAYDSLAKFDKSFLGSFATTRNAVDSRVVGPGVRVRVLYQYSYSYREDCKKAREHKRFYTKKVKFRTLSLAPIP